ncbi:cytosolic sulfotransferase 3 isoform X2 [Amia ocellicauda]|uniref:cytosolic sulfotransferase 3 isoform X2 n=1 Tax=Amia ocellicauda TaxID=2972642 RepID=UPI00346450E1|nr:ST1S3 sulfotransferase [Amia calva]
MELVRPELFDFRGVAMTNYFTDNFDNVEKFSAKPDDILIATYPKAGTTWMSHMLDQIYFGENPETLASEPVFHRVPFMEICAPGIMTGVELIENMTSSPRLIKTHLPVQLVPKSFWEQNCRVIYVARNPKDNAVSYYHFDRMNKLQPEPGNWESFLERFKQGQMVFGSWYPHVKGWWERKQTNPRILYLFYEDLKEDTDRELGRLCEFLGVSLSEESRQRVLRAVGFQSMRENNMTNSSSVDPRVLDQKISPFLRKGMVADWKNQFSVSQSEEFDEDYQRKMKDTTLTFRMEI